MLSYESFEFKKIASRKLKEAFQQNDFTEEERISNILIYSMIYKKLWEMRTKIPFEIWNTSFKLYYFCHSKNMLSDKQYRIEQIIQMIAHSNSIHIVDNIIILSSTIERTNSINSVFIEKEILFEIDFLFRENNDYQILFSKVLYVGDDSKYVSVLFKTKYQMQKCEEYFNTISSFKNVAKKYRRYLQELDKSKGMTYQIYGYVDDIAEGFERYINFRRKNEIK